MKRVWLGRVTSFRETFCDPNAVKAVEYAVRNVSTASSCKYRKVSYGSISQHCIQMIHLIRRGVTKKNTLKRFNFPVSHPEAEAEASGLGPQTYLSDRTII